MDEMLDLVRGIGDIRLFREGDGSVLDRKNCFWKYSLLTIWGR
jgi:hypothetical protein